MPKYDGEERRVDTKECNMIRQIIAGIIIVVVGSWAVYISAKGINLDAMIAGINTRVSVLETVASTIKEDIIEIKTLIKEIREDQKRTRGR